MNDEVTIICGNPDKLSSVRLVVRRTPTRSGCLEPVRLAMHPFERPDRAEAQLLRAPTTPDNLPLSPQLIIFPSL